ncbi:MAG: Uma2 family endonuclease [Leptolyngbyaceae cyanobacterium bins.349]|nr:Uma2 family endonuclease [Leptolyngbyaceae cyanobacterium bins.349]
MISQLQPSTQPDIIYPDSDGQPMADNTKQFRWIVTVKENLERLFRDRADVFVAGDLLWYPVEGNNTLRQAPDAMVAFGRPKGDRGSYKQWEEDNLPPQVVFEILSPGNRMGNLARKFQFYNRYGVEEYYVYDPDDIELIGWRRGDAALEVIEIMDGWVSPRLGIKFDLSQPELQIYYPDGSRFLTYVELAEQLEQEQQRTEQERQRTEQERQRAEQEHQRAEELAQELQKYRDRFGDLE